MAEGDLHIQCLLQLRVVLAGIPEQIACNENIEIWREEDFQFLLNEDEPARSFGVVSRGFIIAIGKGC